MSSPFHPSHRRSRSHSSLSTPCSSPAPHQSQWRTPTHRAHACPKTLPCDIHGMGAHCAPAPKSAFDLSSWPPAKWDVDRWRRGKRARCDPESPSGDADMESGDEAVASSPCPIHDRPVTHSAWMSSSKLPSTSESFQFSTLKPQGRAQSTHKVSPDAMDGVQFAPQTDRLALKQSAAFTDLRKSVEEAGEGFIRRMREFEAQRSLAGPAVTNTATQRAFHKRGRKRPSPRTSKHFAFPPASRGHDSTDNLDDEDESDIEILSSVASSSDDFPHSSPTKKRAVSLCALNDMPYCSQQQQSLSSPVRPTGPVLGSLEGRRGTSLIHSNSNSSDEDEDLHFDAQRPRRARKMRRPRYLCDASSAESTAPSLSLSANSSMQSLPLGIIIPNGRNSAAMNDGEECNFPTLARVQRDRPNVPERSTKYTEKAVAALSLALANGAGSVTEYDGLRNAHDVFHTDDNEVGNLWH